MNGMERLFLIPQPETLTNKLKHIRCCSSVKPTKDMSVFDVIMEVYKCTSLPNSGSAENTLRGTFTKSPIP